MALVVGAAGAVVRQDCKQAADDIDWISSLGFVINGEPLKRRVLQRFPRFADDFGQSNAIAEVFTTLQQSGLMELYQARLASALSALRADVDRFVDDFSKKVNHLFSIANQIQMFSEAPEQNNWVVEMAQTFPLLRNEVQQRQALQAFCTAHGIQYPTALTAARDRLATRLNNWFDQN